VNAHVRPRAAVRALVLSEHEAVRRQLVAYLGRAPGVEAIGRPFAVDAIREAHPEVVVLDLSRLGRGDLGRAIAAAGEVGARLIALASVREAADEREVLRAGGAYLLKAVGADGLAAVVAASALPVASPARPAAVAAGAERGAATGDASVAPADASTARGGGSGRRYAWSPVTPGSPCSTA
jgi:DNA-binding NarL/FixJ family response regulator